MKKNFSPIILVIIILGYSGCFNSVNNKEILGTWKVVEIMEVNSNVPEMEDMMENLARKMFISEGYTLSLFSDNKYSDISGNNYESGEWSLINGGELKYGTTTIFIDDITSKKGKKYFIGTNTMNEGETKLKLKFKRIGEPLEKIEKDPYHPINNMWRIKPDKPESNVEIYNRLINYVNHFALLFYAAYKRDLKRVTWDHSSGVIKVYGNGIGSIDFQNINKNWINCFYDENDAKKASQFYESIFHKLNYYGEDSDNRFLNKYNMLMGIHDRLQLERERLY